jgi:serine phosphatase RsbU (regulator of sigma subunit)
MSDQRRSQAPVRLAGYDSWFYQDPVSDSGGDVLVSLPVPSHADSPGGPPNRWLIALGDVAGKGKEASRLKESLEAEVVRLVGETNNPATTLNRLNSFYGGDERFATLVVAVIDGDRHELTFANAGHLSPLLRRCDGRVETLGEEIAGYPLWVVTEQTYQEVTVPIMPGEVVVFWSDGVTAELDPYCNLFAFDRLLLAITHAERGARSVGESVVNALTDFRGGRARVDDITLLCLGRVVRTDQRS